MELGKLCNQIGFAAIGPDFLIGPEANQHDPDEARFGYFHWFVFLNNPEVLDIMATLSNLAVRAAAFATTYPECLHWKYRQRWVGDMVIYGSLLLQISLIEVFFGPCAVGFGSTKSHKNQVIMSYRQHDWNQDTYLPG